MCILVTDINASGQSALAVRPVLLSIEPSSLLVLLVPMFLVIAIPVVVTRSLVQPSARRGLSGTPITGNAWVFDFVGWLIHSLVLM
ncbi:hypothetical protein EV424DRAFT_242864 [Suillus variegatus]|nr:hypothetical protein EV424DRAFT_242864 [Suillus variegatus]